MKRIIIFSIMALSVLFSQVLANQNPTKEYVFEEIVKIYKYINQVSFDFDLIEEKFSGRLIAKKGNKYKMEINEREIFCNGKTVWNYSPSENKVYISDFEEFEDQLSIDKIFFSFLERFKPKKLSEVKTSDGKKAYTLELKTDKKFETTMHISTVEIWIDVETYDIIRFRINEPQLMTWDIKKLRLRKQSNDKIFNFEPPKDCVIVDLRN